VPKTTATRMLMTTAMKQVLMTPAKTTTKDLSGEL
jgi:hypothetical protein